MDFHIEFDEVFACHSLIQCLFSSCFQVAHNTGPGAIYVGLQVICGVAVYELRDKRGESGDKRGTSGLFFEGLFFEVVQHFANFDHNVFVSATVVKRTVTNGLCVGLDILCWMGNVVVWRHQAEVNRGVFPGVFPSVVAPLNLWVVPLLDVETVVSDDCGPHGTGVFQIEQHESGSIFRSQVESVANPEPALVVHVDRHGIPVACRETVAIVELHQATVSLLEML